MSEAETYEGGCLCGQVRYRIQGPIDSVVHCHCGMCRRWSGAVAMAWITVPLERFEIAKGEVATFRSSSHGERRYCPACASQIAFWSSRRPGEIDITLGTLDHPEGHAPQRHIWTSSRLPDIHLDEHLPAHMQGSDSEIP